MIDRLGHKKHKADDANRHRVLSTPSVIMVPTLGPRRRSSQDAALERQLELLRRAVRRQAEADASG